MSHIEDAGAALAAARARRDSHYPDAEAVAIEAGHKPGTAEFDACVARTTELWAVAIAGAAAAGGAA